MTARINTRPLFTPEVFAMLGGSTVAYVREMQSDDVALMYPQAPALVPGVTVFILHAADGTPLTIADSLEEAAGEAASHQLETVSVH